MSCRKKKISFCFFYIWHVGVRHMIRHCTEKCNRYLINFITSYYLILRLSRYMLYCNGPDVTHFTCMPHMNNNPYKEGSLFTRSLPLSRGSGQWGWIPVTGEFPEKAFHLLLPMDLHALGSFTDGHVCEMCHIWLITLRLDIFLHVIETLSCYPFVHYDYDIMTLWLWHNVNSVHLACYSETKY